MRNISKALIFIFLLTPIISNSMSFRELRSGSSKLKSGLGVLSRYANSNSVSRVKNALQRAKTNYKLGQTNLSAEKTYKAVEKEVFTREGGPTKSEAKKFGSEEAGLFGSLKNHKKKVIAGVVLVGVTGLTSSEYHNYSKATCEEKLRILLKYKLIDYFCDEFVALVELAFHDIDLILFKELMPYILKYFEDFNVCLLAEIVKICPEVSESFAKKMVNCLEEKKFVIPKIIKYYPQAAQLFAPIMLKNLSVYNVYECIAEVIDVCPEFAKQFALKMVNNLSQYEPSSISCIIKAYPEAAKMFAPEMLKDLKKFRDNIKLVVEAYPEAAKVFAPEIAKDLEGFSSDLTEKVECACPEASKIFRLAKLRIMNYPDGGVHSKEHALAPYWTWRHRISDESIIHDQVYPALQREEEILQNDMIPLYHAHRIEYDLLHLAIDEALKAIQKARPLRQGSISEILGYRKLNDLYAVLRVIKDNISKKRGLLLEHFYVQVPQKPIELIDDKEFEEVVAQAGELQKEMMKGPAENEGRKINCLSANPFAFSNITNRGSCTVSYIESNSNVNGLLINWRRDFFKPMGASESIIKKYEMEFQELQDQYAKCFKRGCLLQIAIPKRSIDELVYLAEGGGRKVRYRLENGGEVDSFLEFLQEMEKGNVNLHLLKFDRLELAVPLTQAGVLNPFSGIKVYRYMPKPIDEKRYREVMKKFDQLMEEVTQEIIQDRKSANQNLNIEQASASCA